MDVLLPGKERPWGFSACGIKMFSLDWIFCLRMWRTSGARGHFLPFSAQAAKWRGVATPIIQEVVGILSKNHPSSPSHLAREGEGEQVGCDISSLLFKYVQNSD